MPRARDVAASDAALAPAAGAALRAHGRETWTVRRNWGRFALPVLPCSAPCKLASASKQVKDLTKGSAGKMNHEQHQVRPRNCSVVTLSDKVIRTFS